MSQIASFYLVKDGQKKEISDGDCLGDVYMAIWDYCEGELDIDCRINAPISDETLDCVLIDSKMAVSILKCFQNVDIEEIAESIAEDWELTADIVKDGLTTLLTHLKSVKDGVQLLYEMT